MPVRGHGTDMAHRHSIDAWSEPQFTSQLNYISLPVDKTAGGGVTLTVALLRGPRDHLLLMRRLYTSSWRSRFKLVCNSDMVLPFWQIIPVVRFINLSQFPLMAGMPASRSEWLKFLNKMFLWHLGLSTWSANDLWNTDASRNHCTNFLSEL